MITKNPILFVFKFSIKSLHAQKHSAWEVQINNASALSTKAYNRIRIVTISI